MSWLHRYRLLEFLRSSFWAAPSLAIFCAIFVARALRVLDEVYHWQFFSFSPDGARAIIGALVGSMLTFIVMLVSSLLLVVQLVSAQLTPRIIGPAFRHILIRVTLSIFVFSYTLSIAVVGRIDDVVPQLAVCTAIAINVVCIILFLYFVGRLGLNLRPAHVLARVATDGRKVIVAIYPKVYDPSDPHAEQCPVTADRGEPVLVVEHTRVSGVLLAFDDDGLVKLARRHNVVIQLVPRVGDFVATGEVLFRVYGPAAAAAALDTKQLKRMIVLGAERTLEQDPGLAFRIIVDISSKALSPAINDPTTSVLAIDQLHRLLRWVGMRQLHSGRLTDAAGAVRVLFPTPSWLDYVWLATAEVRHFGADSIQVSQRLRAMLEQLIQHLPEPRRPPLREQLRLLDQAIDRKFDEPEDRLRIRTSEPPGGQSRA